MTTGCSVPSPRERRETATVDLLRCYLRQIARYEPLSREEENRLVGIIAEGERARQLLQRQDLDLAAREELEAKVRAEQQAREELALSCTRLVVSIAMSFLGKLPRGVPLMDLIQDGNVGLIIAAQRFSPGKGTRFSTYATYWIRQTILRGLDNTSRTVRIPSRGVELLTRIRRTQEQLCQFLGRIPNREEIARAAGVSPDMVHMLELADEPLQQLDHPDPHLDEDDDLMSAQIPDPAPPPEEIVMRADLVRELGELLGRLPDRERFVLVMRYGLNGEREHSLEEIGRMLGVSRERARQLEAAALNRLRHPRVLRLLQEYCG